jgi:TPP-dependent pyruvate/acetoin dehydrogenase alpha subunit
MGELLGKLTGYCGGRGGSQHLCSMADHFLGTNGITGGGIPIGTGAALAIRYRNLDDIVVVFFGDGASNQGTFHESLNLAALWKLPVLYVCENNGYGMSNPVRASTAGPGIAERAAAYGLRGERRDGMDLLQVRDAAGELADYVRQEHCPALLELTTYRHCGHSKNDPRVYRTPAEENDWQACDCLLQAAAHLTALGLSDDAIENYRRAARHIIDEAVRAALAAPCGTSEHARGGVYA